MHFPTRDALIDAVRQRAMHGVSAAIVRGQADGSFRSDVPAAWHLSMLMALIHAASAELQAARVGDGLAEGTLVSTVLGALGAPPAAQPKGSSA